MLIHSSGLSSDERLEGMREFCFGLAVLSDTWVPVTIAEEEHGGW